MEDLLNHPHLPEKARNFLHAKRGAFLFGSTAPDVQCFSDQPRPVTHFFNLPVQAWETPPWERLLSEHPSLAVAQQLPVSQAAFLAGYLCHLQADWRWMIEIYVPFFGPDCSWDTFLKRLYYHNVFRAYLDRLILPGLSMGIDGCLRQVKPDTWLPFVAGHYLAEWRDFISSQLQPGAVTQTVEVFSSRQGISAPEYYTLLDSAERMQAEVFTHFPMELLQGYRRAVLDDNVSLVATYLAFTLHYSSVPSKERLPRGV